MELYDEQKELSKSKVPLIIGICITVLIIMTITVIYGIFYLKSTITTISIDNVRNTEIEKIFYIESTEEGKELYIPIIKMANFLKYEGFNGDYKNKSEDKTKCHVTCDDETAMFSLDSDVLVKIAKNSEKEYIKLDKPVFEMNGELYTTIQGVEKAFNISFAHDKKFKNIEINTMNFLVEYCANALKIEKFSDIFSDKKAIFEEMIIIQENGQYGVLNVTTKQKVLETKYQDIKYLPTTSEFLIKSNGKYGVMTKEATTKIKTVYDEIKEIDNKNGLYLVKKNNAYGVIDTAGNVIIEPDYKQIGLSDISKYIENGVDSKYVLLDEIIPVQNSDNLWAFFNLQGEKITDFIYTGVGSESSPATNSYPALVVPSHKMIVVKNDKKYNLITFDGEEMILGNILDAVYFKYDVTTGENKYYMTLSNNTKVINIEEWLTSIGE